MSDFWFQKLQSGIRICGQLAAGMLPVMAEVALGVVSCDPGGILTYITCISPLKID